MKTTSEFREILERIEEMTDPNDGSNYRSDDREGCLDTVHSLVTAALKSDPITIHADPEPEERKDYR